MHWGAGIRIALRPSVFPSLLHEPITQEHKGIFKAVASACGDRYAHWWARYSMTMMEYRQLPRPIRFRFCLCQPDSSESCLRISTKFLEGWDVWSNERLDLHGDSDFDADPKMLKEFYHSGIGAVARISLTTQKVVDEFLRNFWDGWDVSLVTNRSIFNQ